MIITDLIGFIKEVLHALSHSSEEPERIPEDVEPEDQHVQLFNRLPSVMAAHFGCQLGLVVKRVLPLKESQSVNIRRLMLR